MRAMSHHGGKNAAAGRPPGAGMMLEVGDVHLAGGLLVTLVAYALIWKRASTWVWICFKSQGL
eukprot:5764015-Lingulodinium_polyedra.AAC.1